ncbi:MAG: hypothetical protein WC242_03570 [Candidatus Paceibacterota bacterium]|jgi:hypothetical protein
MEQVREKKNLNISSLVFPILPLFSTIIMLLKAFGVMPLWNIGFNGISISNIFVCIEIFLVICLWLIPKKKDSLKTIIAYGLFLSFCAGMITI